MLKNRRLMMREEFGSTWHHPLHWVNEFSLVAELAELPPKTQLSFDYYLPNEYVGRSSTSNLLDYFDTALDEQLYKDREGLPCRNCNHGILERESTVKFADLGGATALFFFIAAMACVSFGIEFMTKTVPMERSQDKLVAEARTRLKTFSAEISQETANRVLGFRSTKRADFDGLSKEATSALQGAEIIMEEAKLYRDDKVLGRFCGGMLFIGALALGYFGLAQLGHRSYLKCICCGHVVRGH